MNRQQIQQRSETFFEWDSADKSYITTTSTLLFAEEIARMVKEECAKLLEISNQELLLMAGDMSKQELRTVRAVLANRALVIRK